MSLHGGGLVLHLIEADALDEVAAALRQGGADETLRAALAASYGPRYDEAGRRTKYGFAVELEDSGLAGLALLGVSSWRHRRGYTGADTLPALRGRGVAPRSKPHLFRLAFDVLGLHRVETGCAVSNTSSRRAIEKVPGFLFEGVLRGHTRGPGGAFEDERRYAILRSDWERLYEPEDIAIHGAPS